MLGRQFDSINGYDCATSDLWDLLFSKRCHVESVVDPTFAVFRFLAFYEVDAKRMLSA